MGLGFKGKSNHDSDKEFDNELDDLDIDFDDLDDDDNIDDLEDIPKTTRPIQSKRSKNKEKEKETKVKQKTPIDKKRKIIIGIIAGILIMLFGFVGFLVFSGNDNDNAQASASLQTNEAPKTEKPKDEKPKEEKNYPTDVNPGVPDIQMGSNMTQNSDTSDPKDFLKDINGNKVPKKYDVARIERATDFIDYTKRRAVTGDGVELLWLDATYKGRKYEVQVPFEVYKELDSSGITVVDVEILHTRGGGTIVSYMNVRKDYKQLLKNKEQQ